MSSDLKRKFMWSLMLALLVYIALALYSDWQKLVAELNEFPWLLLPLVLGLTLVNYIGRLIKWHWYLGLLKVPIDLWDSARIFGVGMLMVMTPGKAGEFLKSYMVKNRTGVPMSVTAPVVLAERMTDGMAMLLLASAGLFAFPNLLARGVAALVFGIFIVFVVVVQIRPLALWCLSFGEKLPIVKKFASSLHEFYESSYIIFGPRNLAISLGIGIVSWLAEGIAYYLVLLGFGATPGLNTFLLTVFSFCISTVIGATVATPGGLGGVEASLVTLSTQFLGLATATATAAALLIRFCTLWFGVAIGVISFALWPQLLAGSEQIPSEQPVAGD